MNGPHTLHEELTWERFEAMLRTLRELGCVEFVREGPHEPVWLSRKFAKALREPLTPGELNSIVRVVTQLADAPDRAWWGWAVERWRVVLRLVEFVGARRYRELVSARYPCPCEIVSVIQAVRPHARRGSA